jgi:chromosome segregation ATPase
MPYSEEEKTAIMAEARANASAPRFDHTNVVIMTPRKVEPEPERPSRTFTDSEITRMIGQAAADLRNALADQKTEIMEWAESEIESTLDSVDTVAALACNLDDRVISLSGDVSDIKRKAIETDIVNLQSETASLRADLDALRGVVETLANQITELRDDMIDRSAGNVVALKGTA